jgi:hypothetical protein
VSEPVSDAAWLAFWVGFGLLDWTADRRGRSLCVTVRRLWRLNTHTGRAIGTAAYTAGALVLYRHVFKR